MIYIGSDHFGYKWKKAIHDYLEAKGIQVIDLGVFAIEEQADYPDIAREVAEKIAENPDAKGVLIDSTGIGMMMAANQVPGVRATVATNSQMAEVARSCNDANIVCLGTKVVVEDQRDQIVETFIKTEFNGNESERRCVQKLGK